MMDNKQKLFSNNDNSHLLRQIIEEKVNAPLNEPLSKLIKESQSHDVQEIVSKSDLQPIEDEILNLRKTKKCQQDLWSNISLNYDDYAVYIEGLRSNSTTTKLKVLDKLLNIQIIDTKNKNWSDLSEGLRKCFVSANNEIFTRTLKIHHRLITFPSSSCDGYLSLLKSTFLLLNSRYFTDLNKTRIWQTFQLILYAQNLVIKYLLHANHNIIDEILLAFVNVISYKSVFDWFGVLDPKTSWLRYFCYGTHIRNTFFNYLQQKNPNFIKNIITSFIGKYSNNGDESGQCYDYFLLYFLRYNNNLKIFPLKSNDHDEIHAEKLLELMILKINQRQSSEAIDVIINIFDNNPSLLSRNLLDLLVEPLGSINRNNIDNLVANNGHVLTIINNIAETSNCKVLFGVFTKLKKGRSRPLTRNTTNLPQKIVDLTIILLKFQINQTNNTAQTELVPLLRCCQKIYEGHPVALIQVNPLKFIKNLHDFYRIVWKQCNDEIKNEILHLFKFFYSNYGQIINIFGCDTDILDDLFSFGHSKRLKIVINRIANDKIGFEFLKNNYGQIIKPYLEEIWYLEETESDEDNFVKFVLFLFVLQFTTKAIVAFLSDDDESTVVQSDDKTIVLTELIEKTINNCNCESVEEYLGLLTMKVIITNLDLLLHLQANYQIQEKLKTIQDDYGEIIDAQSSLRQNILISIEIAGFNAFKSNLLERTDPIIVPDNLKIFDTETSDNELKTFLETNENHNKDFGWLQQARRAFRHSLEAFHPSTLITLLEQIPKTYVYRKIDLQWPPSDSVYYQLHPEDFCGISMIIKFGLKSGLIAESPSHEDNLILLIKQSRTFLNHQPESFTNFDWFVGIIYLISSGDFENCKSVLINFTNTPVTSLVWATFGKEFDSVLKENFHQHFEVILEENCSCFQALKMLGISPEMMVQSWLNQCFFNFLKFEEICNFLAFSVLYPVECVLYYILAIFHHLNERICTVTHSPKSENILELADLSNFKLSDYIDLIEKLMKHYRNSHKL